MLKNEILEYPYVGTITRVVVGDGMEDDGETIIYDGVMDEHMVTDEEGSTLQTSSYIISIPLVIGDDGNWVVPRKGDKVSVTRYGESFSLNVDNAEPSQVGGGVSVYCSRNSWQ